jgi:hypothetical protein
MHVDLWWQLLPVHPDERTLLIWSIAMCLVVLWIGNLLLYKLIINCPIRQLFRFELFCVGFFGIFNTIVSSIDTKQNMVNSLSNKYVFSRSNRYTANAPVNSVFDYVKFCGMLLINLLLLALLLQQIDSPRNALYHALIDIGFTSPYLNSAPVTQVNAVFVSTSQLCVVVQQTDQQHIVAIPIGRYAPFIWQPSLTVGDTQLMTIEQSKSRHSAVQIAPVMCDGIWCRTHLDIRPELAPVIIGYDNFSALNQLDVRGDQWYISAVPRQAYEGMYFVEIRADGIRSIEPSPAIQGFCAR